MSDFICKKCGSTEYEIKDKPNGTGIAHGLYCAKCGFWHKWLGKEELKQYATKESKDDIIAKLQSENADLRERLGKFDDLHIHMGEKVYIIADDNEIIERFICGVHILSTEIIFVTTTQKNYKPCNKKRIAAHIAHAFENSFGLIPLRDFGERAFIHRESALVRLAERS